ncbi:MAG: hypothetical protein ACM3SS_02270 [Rhodospirillaceae bacterium]
MLGIAVAAAAALVVFHLAPSATPRDDDSSAAQRATREHELQEAVRQARARLERGAYVHTRKRISDTEEVQVLIVPEARADALDTRCIIYTNSELKTSSITCNGPTWHNAGGAS